MWSDNIMFALQVQLLWLIVNSQQPTPPTPPIDPPVNMLKRTAAEVSYQ